MNQLLYLSQAEVTAVNIPMSQIIESVAAAFREKGNGRVEMPPKPGIHPGGGDNFIHAMPAYIPGLQSAGVKWVSGFPDNQKRGLPYITGLLILNDVETGLPLAVMDCVWITAMRTAAATAVALWLFALGARRVTMVTLGLLQYIAPTLQFLVGVFVYKEAFGGEQMVGFGIIWLALLIYSAESILVARKKRVKEFQAVETTA